MLLNVVVASVLYFRDRKAVYRLGLLGQGSLLPDETAGFAKVGSLGMRSAVAVSVRPVLNELLPGEGSA